MSVFAIVFFVIIILCCFTVAKETIEKNKKETGKSNIVNKNIILSACIGLLAIILVIYLFAKATANNSSPSTANKGNVERCEICGGKLKCAICGKSGLYCEKASYGAGTDHYCNTHWADCVEWHEKKKK